MWFSFFITWEQRKFGEVFTYERPDRYIVASDKYSDYYSTPVLTANKGFILGYTNEQRTYNHPCVIFDDFTLDSKYVDFPFMVKSSALKILTAKQGYYLPFAYELLHAANIEVLGHARHYISVVQPTAVLVPNYPEQLRIGKFIEAIDNLITLHQRKQNWQNSRFLRKISSLILAIAWEQRKLGDVVSRFATGLNPRDNFTLNSGGKNYYVTIKNFTHGNLVLDDNCDKIDDEALALIQARSDLRIGDILFSSIGRVGDCFLIENRPINWNINESVFVLRPVKDAVDPLYLMHTIHSERVLSVILSCVTGSTFKSIKMAQLKETNIPYPNIVEQKQIGKFITAIDNLITLHQCKRAAFVSRKSPSIFQFEKWRNTLTWEQRKFGEVFTYERPDRYIVASDKYSDYYSTPVLTANKGFILGYTNEQRTYNHPCVIFDDFTLDSKYVDFPFMVKSSALKILTAKQGYYLPFAYELLHAANIEVLGHARHYISVVQPTAVLVPNYPEQLRIGKFIEAIDNLITLHQRKQNWQNSRFLRKISSLILAIAWEQRKLGDVVSRFATGLNPRDNFTLNSGGKNYYVTIKNFTHGNLVLDDNCDKIDDEALALIQARSDLRIGDILFSSIGRVGDCFLIENRPINWNINESVFVLRPVKDAVDPLYLMHTIHSERVLSVILSCVTGSTFKSIKMAQLKETNIPYPNIVEQKQIGKFITAIDNLITLHQRGENIYNRRQTW